MSFNPNNFIKNYQATDKYVTLLYNDGKIFRVINVCQHKKLSISSKLLIITQEGGTNISLQFNTVQDCRTARDNFQSVIDQLSLNCSTSSSTGVIPNINKELITVTTNGQTVFINGLSYAPTISNSIELFVNGVFEDTFTISGRTLTWLETNYSLQTTDKIYIIYQ